MDKKVVIMRGPNGSGKSTWARKNHTGAPIVSTDNFWLVEETDEETGETTKSYQFDIARLGEAHAWAICEFVKLLEEGEDTVVVDNTNIRHWEYSPFETMAKAMGYVVDFVEILPETIDDIKLCIERCVHDIPPERTCFRAVCFEPRKGAVRIPFHRG